MRPSCVWGWLALAPVVLGQQAPFIPVTGADAPKGAAFLLAAREGGLWLGGMEAGGEGLTYFDGSRFVTPVEDFPRITVTGMVEDSEGGLWIASPSGIYRTAGGKVERRMPGAAQWGILKVAEDVFLTAITAKEGDSRAGADIIRIDRRNGEWRLKTVLQAFHLRTRFLTADNAGNILFPCPSGYCEFGAQDIRQWREGEILRISEHALALPSSANPMQVYRDKAGCIWWDGDQSGVLYQCPADARPAKLAAAGVDGTGAPIAELAGGDIVIATQDRMVLGRPGTWRVFTPAMGYPVAASVLTQDDATVWISNGKGIFVFPTRNRFEFWTEREGLSGVVRAVLPRGSSVFAAAGGGIVTLDSDRTRWRTLVKRSAVSLLPGARNSIIAGGPETGVAEIAAGGHLLGASPPASVARLARTPDGRTWAGGDGGVANVNLASREIGLHPAGPAEATSGTVDLAADPAGGLWGCSAQGLFHEEKGEWRVITKKQGLLVNACRSFAVDANGDVWYGYADPASAFSLIENSAGTQPVVRHYASGGDIGTATNNFMFADRRGWLWRGTEDGLYAATLDQAKAGQWLYMNRSDGLPSPDTNRRSLYEDADGSLWFGMGTNVVHFSPPGDFLAPGYAPAVFVSGFSVKNGPFQRRGAVGALDYGGAVTAHIGSLQMDRRNALRLRYRLDAAAWKPTRVLDIPLGSLPPGAHTLEIEARLFTGPWSKTVRQSFLVSKPLWLQWPALFSMVLVGGGTALGAAATYRRRRRKLSAELPGLAEWRAAALSAHATGAEGSVLDGRFEVGRLLARGGFGTVFAGRDLEKGQRCCAIKIFRQEFKDKDWIERRFRQEVSALTQICHPNVVGIYGHGTAENGAPYLAMEFIEGDTLREALDKSRLSRKRVAAYLRQTGSALSAIHAHHVCHRDLKPENLMIRKNAKPGREIVLIDFSIAIVKDPDETMHGLSRAAGTLHYMAPEQAIGYADASSDIYSLAKILIEMLTGERLSALLPDASIDLPARVREFLVGSSLDLALDSVELVGSALEFDPSRRPHDANAFAACIAQDLEA